jgi:hypothetical protein
MRTEPLRMGVIHQTPVRLGGDGRVPLQRKAGKSVAELSDGWAHGPGPPRDQGSAIAGRPKSSPSGIPSPRFADPGGDLAGLRRKLADSGLEKGGRGVQIALTLARLGELDLARACFGSPWKLGWAGGSDAEDSRTARGTRRPRGLKSKAT